MGWFDEQIRQRIQHDDDAFSDAFAGLAGVLMGRKLADALNDDRILTKNAIDEMLRYYHVKPQELPDHIVDIDDQLEYLMRPSGIMRRIVWLKSGWYKDAAGAMIGVLKEDHRPAALIPDRFGRYSYYDAKTGQRVRLNKHTEGNLEEEAICFYKPLPMKQIGIRDLMVYIMQTLSGMDILLAAAAALCAALAGMLIPKINNMIYSEVVTGSNYRLLYAVFAFLFCVSVSQTLITVFKDLIMSRIQNKMNIAVEAAAMMRVLSLPASFFKQYSSGELADRLDYIRELCSLLISTLLSTGLTAIFSMLYITQMVKYGPGMAGPGLMIVLFTVISSLITTLIQMRISRKTMELSAKEAGLNYALISGVQKIKLSGAEKRAFARWAGLYKENAELNYDPPVILKLTKVVSACITLVGTIVIYYYTIKSGASLADYYAFNAAYGMVMGAFVSLTGIAAQAAQIKPMLEMAKPMLQTVPEVAETKKVVSRISGGIELNNVSFRYAENSPMIIDDLSLKIRPGQYVAIVGASGCGKSTLMRLMLGFEKPLKGAIYYDGKDMASLDLKSLRRNIGTVMQNGKLFQGDIFSNIVIAAPSLTMDDAWEAAEMAGVAEDIQSMPMGMHTVIAEGSGGISGGQRQRLLIARAIAPKPKVLMFDEATSALDNITQKKVSDSLDALKCTRIVIAHRLSTIRQCDRIIVLDKGKIVEDGKYEDLIARKGFFAQLVERQQVERTA